MRVLVFEPVHSNEIYWFDKRDVEMCCDTYGPLPKTKKKALKERRIGHFYEHNGLAVTGSGCDSLVLLTPWVVAWAYEIDLATRRLDVEEEMEVTQPDQQE